MSDATNEDADALPEDHIGAPVAFFDMDKTVLSVNSASRYARWMFRRGELRIRDMFRTARWLVQYRLAIIDAQAVTRKAMATVAGSKEAHMVALCREWFEVDIKRFITDAAVRRIEDHRAKGHQVVLLTAATPYIAEPVAAHLELDGCICTRLRVDPVDGCFTGEPVEPLCFGRGKIDWAEAWVRERGSNLDSAWFYTDSYTDLPMVERVARPVAVNPDPRLRRYARRRQIPIETWA